MGQVIVQPFEYAAGSVGCLLVHGLTGSPYEVQSLGERLWHAGFSVYGPRLAGHATDDWHDLAQSRWTDWYSDVKNGYDQLAKRCHKIILIGLSIGGALCLRFAIENPNSAAALVVMATPLQIMTRREYLAAKLAVAMIPGHAFRQKTSSTIKDPLARSTHISGRHIAFAAALSGVELLREIKPNLSKITTPTLLIYSKSDPVVQPTDGEYIFSRIGSVEKQLLWLTNSYHIITRDYEQEFVESTVLTLATEVRDGVKIFTA